MPAKVTLRSDFDALQLRQFAKRSSDTRQTCRLLALAAVYDGMSRGEAAKVGGMDRQTLRDWVHRFNDLGPDGLVNSRGPKRKRRLSEAQLQALAEIVETGPDPEVDGVVRWRRVDLQRDAGMKRANQICGSWRATAIWFQDELWSELGNLAMKISQLALAFRKFAYHQESNWHVGPTISPTRDPRARRWHETCESDLWIVESHGNNSGRNSEI